MVAWQRVCTAPVRPKSELGTAAEQLGTALGTWPVGTVDYLPETPPGDWQDVGRSLAGPVH